MSPHIFSCKNINFSHFDTRVSSMIVFIFIMLLSACEDTVASKNTPEQTYYHKASSQILAHQDSYKVLRKFSGTIMSKQSSNLTFEVSGRVANIYVDEGDNVIKGQPLADLDTELLHIEFQQLQAQLSQVQAEADLVDANLVRILSLIEKGYVSTQKKDELQAQQKVLAANKLQIKANIAGKNYQITHAQITAPFAGTINKRNINVGEIINPQISSFHLQQRSNNELKVGVPQHLIAKIQNQQDFKLIINKQKLTVNSLAINTDLSQQSRTVQLRFPLPNDMQVYNNQLGYFTFTQEYQQTGFWVPLTSLTDGIRGTWNIYTLDAIAGNSDGDGKKANLYKLVSHSIEIIHSEQDKAFIRGNLSDGELLLSGGIQRLVPGQIVRIEP
ncbi:efflux RND transporter periplasmic adaptor subunit [Colwelliaceae bacterium BS250]